MLPPFHGERMRGYEQVIREATERAVAGWPQGTEFALHPSMQAITLEVILRAVFGVDDAARREDLRDQPGRGALGERLPGGGRLRRPRRSGRLPPFRRIAAMRERADELLYAEIAEHRRLPDLDERDDILSMLLTARFEDGSEMDDRELRDQLMTLLLAGHETTATGLAWAFDLLLHHPEALVRLRGRARGRRARIPRRGDRRDAAGAARGPVHRPPAAPGRPCSTATSCPPGR